MPASNVYWASNRRCSLNDTIYKYLRYFFFIYLFKTVNKIGLLLSWESETYAEQIFVFAHTSDANISSYVYIVLKWHGLWSASDLFEILDSFFLNKKKMFFKRRKIYYMDPIYFHCLMQKNKARQKKIDAQALRCVMLLNKRILASARQWVVMCKQARQSMFSQNIYFHFQWNILVPCFLFTIKTLVWSIYS